MQQRLLVSVVARHNATPHNNNKLLFAVQNVVVAALQSLAAWGKQCRTKMTLRECLVCVCVWSALMWGNNAVNLRTVENIMTLQKQKNKNNHVETSSVESNTNNSPQKSTSLIRTATAFSSEVLCAYF